MPSYTTSTNVHQNVAGSFVLWYYTVANKYPDHLHSFYTKSSAFSYGDEGEEIKTCFGQHEIDQKITSIRFQGCRFFIHSIDAQATLDGGILIQVVGEMSNRGETCRKFVQTFFLAEQPNGYFVLNDIFRLLKEDDVESNNAGDSAEPEVKPAEVVPDQTTPLEPPISTPEPQPTAAATLLAQPNGHIVAAAEPGKPSSAIPIAPTPAPQLVAPHSPSTPVSVVSASSTSRSWTSLAVSNSEIWDSAVEEFRELAETAASPVPSNGPQMPAVVTSAATSHGPSNGKYPPELQSVQAVDSPTCIVMGIHSFISPTLLISTLSEFGPVKALDILWHKGRALVEFSSVEVAKRAIIASLDTDQGGGGGVFVKFSHKVLLRIFIKTGKKGGDRPPPRPWSDFDFLKVDIRSSLLP